MTIKSGRVILINEVRGDWPIGHTTVGKAGVHDAYVNPQGAVSIMAGDGQLLGVKPNEFAWLEKPTIEILPQICKMCGKVHRKVRNFVVERCPRCGDGEYDLYRNCRQI